MSVNLKNPEAERLLNELAEHTGESLTEAARLAFAERLARLQKERAGQQKRQLGSLLDLIAEARQSNTALDARPREVITDQLWGDDE
jgi:antitoxin VapB